MLRQLSLPLPHLPATDGNQLRPLHHSGHGHPFDERNSEPQPVYRGSFSGLSHPGLLGRFPQMDRFLTVTFTLLLGICIAVFVNWVFIA